MLMLTQDAADVIRGLAETPGAEGLRISPAAAEAPGAEEVDLQIELAASPEPEDAVVESEGARLFLAPAAAELLEGRVLDADVEGDRVSFALLGQPENGAGPAPGATN